MQEIINNTWSINSINNFNVLNNKINNIENDLSSFKEEVLKDNLENYNNTIWVSQSIISNWLTNQSMVLWVFSIIFAIVWIILAYKVNEMLTKITKKTEEISEKERIIEVKSKEIEEIKNSIDNNIWDIHEKIVEKETEKIINRLTEYPEDISNFFSSLATRKIDENYYNYFIKIIKDNDLKSSGQKDYIIQYMTIIFQHFSEKIFIDNDSDVWLYFNELSTFIFRNSFKKELFDITSNLTTKFIKKYKNEYQNRFSEYLQLLNTWNYLDKDDKKIKEEIKLIFKNNNELNLLEEIWSDINIDFNIDK